MSAPALRLQLHALGVQLETHDGRLLPNASVHLMFDEAGARFRTRNLEERSLTVGLRKHAPTIAALWVEATLDASWIDWRQKVGPEHTATLDRAIEAVTGCSVRSGGRGSP